MALKFTYILGAGASAHALPLAKDIKKKNTSNNLYDGLATRLNQIGYDLEHEIKAGNIISEAITKHIEQLKHDFKKLSDKSRQFDTIDTLAKYYSLKNNQELEKLKGRLAEYFMIEQLYFKKRDSRYLVFLTTILNNNQFPSNIKILNWNYDYQLEFAAETFKEEKAFSSKQSNDQSPPLINYYPTIGHKNNIDKIDLSLVHLNGLAGFHKQRDDQSIIENPYIEVIEKDFTALYNRLNRNYHTMNQFLNFAWENNDVSKTGVELAKNIINETDIVVIIGYSFPFFNREIDKEIFEVLRQKERLKIYFQDPVLDGQFLYNQFNFDKNKVDIEHIKNTKQFYVPFEM